MSRTEFPEVWAGPFSGHSKMTMPTAVLRRRWQKAWVTVHGQEAEALTTIRHLRSLPIMSRLSHGGLSRLLVKSALANLKVLSVTEMLRQPMDTYYRLPVGKLRFWL